MALILFSPSITRFALKLRATNVEKLLKQKITKNEISEQLAVYSQYWKGKKVKTFASITKIHFNNLFYFKNIGAFFAQFTKCLSVPNQSSSEKNVWFMSRTIASAKGFVASNL